MSEYNPLDKDGLAYLWGKLTEKFALKTGSLKNPNALSITLDGTTTTYDGSAAKTVDIDSKLEAVYNLLKNKIDAARVNGVKVYGAMWDGSVAQMTRLFDAYGITTDTTNFKYSGSVNENYSNPFDSIYPWSEVAQCDVDLSELANLSAGDDLRDAVTAWFGDADFTTTGSSSNFVGQYIPEFWHYAYADDDGNWIHCVADGEVSGFTHVKPFIRGMGFAMDDGSGSKVTAGDGQPLTNVPVSTIHSRAKATGITLMNIYNLDAILSLYMVEFANYNSQEAIGNGVSPFVRENAADKPLVAETGATSVVLPKACAAFCIEGTTLDFGASNGAVVLANRRTVTGYETYSENSDYIEVSFSGGALNITTDMFCSFHGRNCGDSFGNKSGYIGTNGKNNVYYRGAVLHSNRYMYTLGIYRQTGTGRIWLCDPDTTDNYDALNTSDHTDTGAALPEAASAAWQTIKTVAHIDGVHCFAPVATGGGSSAAPVGDSQYVPMLSTANTILLFGGYAGYGAYCGVLCGHWSNTASYSGWNASAVPLIPSP